MKKAVIAVAVLAVAAGLAVAALDGYDGMTYTEVSTLKLATGTQTNSAVDLAACRQGINALVVYVGPSSTNGTASFGASATLTHCATPTGAYSVVTNGAGSAVTGVGIGTNGVGTATVIKLESEKLRRYVKLVTVSTNDTCLIGAMLVSPK